MSNASTLRLKTFGLLLSILCTRATYVSAATEPNEPEPNTLKGKCVRASSQGDIPQLRKLVVDIDSLDVRDEKGKTPLGEAARTGHYSTCLFLLESGASPNYTDVKGETPLHYACRHVHLDIAKSLLDNGGKSEVKNAAGVTPMDELVKLRLAPKSAKPDDLGHWLRIHLIAYIDGLLVGIEHDWKVLEDHRTLLEAPSMSAALAARGTEPGFGTRSAFYTYAGVGLDQGRPITANTLRGMTRFVKSADPLKSQELDYWVRRGIELRQMPYPTAAKRVELNVRLALSLARVAFGEKDLRFTATRREIYRATGQKDRAEKLVKEPENANDKDRLVISIAAKRNRAEAVYRIVRKALAEKETDPTIALEKYAYGQLGFRDLNGLDQMGHTPLLEAVACEDVETTRLLLQFGADVDARGKKDLPTTALHLACLSEQCDKFIPLLLDYWADPKAIDDEGRQPLWFAAIKNLEWTKKLVDLGNEVNRQDSMGTTPLIMACQNGQLEIAKYLVRRSAKVGLRHIDGRAAIDFAREEKHQTIVDWLKKISPPLPENPFDRWERLALLKGERSRFSPNSNFLIDRIDEETFVIRSVPKGVPVHRARCREIGSALGISPNSLPPSTAKGRFVLSDWPRVP